MKLWSVAAALVAITLSVAGARAEDAAPKPTAVEIIKRLQLQRIEFPTDKYATMIYMVEIAPGAVIPRHTHPGVEMTYVQDGEGSLLIEGQPEIMLKKGGSFTVPPATPHSAKNTGATAMKLVVTYVVEKDKPLATLAPLQ